MSKRLSLPELKIASPCPARWEDMRGDDKRRFCESCGKHVHNFAAMREEEIAALLDGRPICAQLYRRPDGTVLTADCPIGIRLARTRLGRLALRAAAASIALLSTAVAALGSRQISERIETSPLNTSIERLQAEAMRGKVLMGDVAPPMQAVRGEVAMPVLGVVAPPASQPATRPAVD